MTTDNKTLADVQPGFTTGHCQHKNRPGGCQLHNLQCGWPNCDRKAVEPSLADAQPGGRVRLGDQAERARFEQYRGGDFERDAQGYYTNPRTAQDWPMWQAALSAQPSPGGQDALAVIEELAELNRACAALDPDYKGPSDAAVQAAISALAARQPVGKLMRSDLTGYAVAASQVRRGYDVECNRCGKFCDEGPGPCQLVGKPVCTDCGTPLLFECTGCSRSNYPKYMHEAIGEIVCSGEGGLQIEFYDGKPLAPMKLYAAPPAQAVDLAKVRQLIGDLRTLDVKESTKNDNAGFVDLRCYWALLGVAGEVERSMACSQAVGK